MRANEFVVENILDETTEQDQILVHVADAATKLVIDIFTGKEKTFRNAALAFSTDIFMSRKDRLTWLSGIRLDKLYLPEVSDPEINRMLRTVKVRVSDEQHEKSPNALGSYISYTNGSKCIDLYLPMIIQTANEVGHMPANQLRSTFIHEMQHALDDIKSQGKYAPDANKDSNTDDEQARYQNYLKLPYEINARFTQALLDISLQYNKIEGPYRLQDLIINAFKNHNLNVASSKQYKHLAGRAYKFFDAIQNSPKKIEPKTLTQRAWAWITSQPTSVIKEDIKKNRWALIVTSPEKHEWADNLIELVNNAYSQTSLGSFVQNASQVAASDWVALDWDPQPDLDCTVFYRKARPNESWQGYKIQGIGHDGKPESKQRVIARAKNLLSKPGVWIESSDAMAKTLGRAGLEPVTDEQVLHALFPDSELTLRNNGSYTRKLTTGATIRETVYGNPIVKR